MRSELSGRELSFLQYAADGLTYRKIAGSMECHESTVTMLARNLFVKLRAENITNAVAIAIRRGLID